MKKFIFALILILALLFVSCSNGGHSDNETIDGSPVKVSLCLRGDVQHNTQRAISINSSADDYSYYIRTTPLWTGSDIQNPYSALTEFNYANNMELGYFSPGTWTFYVEIKNGENIVYTGTRTPVHISTSTKAVSIDMELYDAGESSGSVTLKLAVPKASENAPDITYSYTGASSGNGRVNTTPTADTTVDTNGVTSASINWYYFTKALEDLEPGNYVFTLNYLDENAGNRIGGAIVSFTVRNGDEYGIYGTIEEGEYQIATLFLNMPTVSISLSGAETAAKHATETTTITATASEGATLAWYVNGVLQGGQTGTTFNFSRATAGRFVISCSATSSDGRTVKHASHIIRILP